MVVVARSKLQPITYPRLGWFHPSTSLLSTPSGTRKTCRRTDNAAVPVAWSPGEKSHKVVGFLFSSLHPALDDDDRSCTALDDGGEQVSPLAPSIMMMMMMRDEFITIIQSLERGSQTRDW